MRTIDIFVSAPADAQKEHAVAEQVIRSVTAEFNLSINVCYSNPLLRSKGESGNVGRTDFDNESPLVLCPCFWEYPESESDDFLAQVPDTSQYHLVICILWSRLGNQPSQACFMPDGSQPKSATDYEVAWTLEQCKHTPDRPRLHVYRNRATPAAPLEPKEKREKLCRQWDAVGESYSAWEKNAGSALRESFHDYQDLEEFENLFREHFRDFLAQHLVQRIGSKKAPGKVHPLESNPFRGLNFFDFEHAAFYHGRTKAIGEILDLLKSQATAKRPFILVLGPSGSGKSSLVRAGVLPLLTRGRTPVGNGPWRYALTRPATVGDPFDTLAAALLTKFALPELQEAAQPDELNLASQLRKEPEAAAARIAEVLKRLTQQELERLLAERRTEGQAAMRSEGVDVVSSECLGRLTPKMQLVLVVDQLEELFTRLSPVLQQKYIAALCALANCEGIFIMATLRSDFFSHYERFPELTALGGRYELQPPTSHGIADMIRCRAGATGLRFEQDPETGRSLDEAILNVAAASSELLPLLEHLLSRLYQRQLARKDGLLLWSDYHQLGGLQDTLAQHAEFVFLSLKSNEQHALKFVFRQLLVPGRGEEGLLHRRTAPYGDLVLSPQLDERQRAGAKGMVDRLVKEGLLSAETDPLQGLLISIPQEALLRRWPRLCQLLSDDRHFLWMRDRLDANLTRWVSQGCRRKDLLDHGIRLAEAETLLADFGSQLNESQIDYIRKSLARKKRPGRLPQKIGLAAMVGLAVFAGFVGAEQFNAASRRTNKEKELRTAQQNSDLEANLRSELEAERGTLEIRLKEAEQNLLLAQEKADLANSKRSALETELKKAHEEKAQLAQQNSNLANGKSSEQEAQRSLETQLKDAQDKLQLAQQNAHVANTQRDASEAELKKAQEEKAQLAQQNSNLANGKSSEQEAQRSLETQLKDAQEKLQLAQQNAHVANTQRDALQAELKKAQEEKAQLPQQNTNLADGKSSEQEAQRSLEAQLKDAQEKLQLAQQNADVANTQRDALETELKKAQEEKAQLAQQNSNLANAQSSEQDAQHSLETQLKDAQEKLQLAQRNADLANIQRDASESDLKKAREEKAQLAQQNSNLANAQSSEQEAQRSLEAQLKDAQEKLQLAQRSADLANTQRDAPENQLKNEPVKLEQAQAEAGRANSQLGEFEAQLKQEQETTQRVKATADFYARLNQHQEASPAPSPPATDESETSNPQESQSGQNAKPAGEKESLRQFVLGYLRTVASNDTSMQRRYLADRVNFYGRGILDSSNIEASTERYHQEWPIRQWEPRGEAKVVRWRKRNLFVVYQPFDWTVSDGSHHAHGDATLYLRIRKNAQGEFQIILVRQLER